MAVHPEAECNTAALGKVFVAALPGCAGHRSHSEQCSVQLRPVQRAKGNHSNRNDSTTCLHDERGVVHSDSPNDSSSLSAPSQPDALSRPVRENSAVFACRSTVRSEYIQRMRDKRKLGQAQVGTRARRATRATGSSSAGPLQSESLLADCALASAPCRADRGTTANVARVYCESSTASADRPARGLPSWPCSLCASTVCRPRRGYASACTVAATRAAKREVGCKARSLEYI